VDVILDEPTMSSLPIVCTLTPGAMKARRADLLPGLLGRAVERVDCETGFRVRFPAGEGILKAIAEVVDAERQCCRFLTFAITVEPDGGPVWLGVTGPPGTREFLDALVNG
jgi:hypothetical protein